MKVYLTAVVTVKPEFYQDMKPFLLSLPAESNKEKACIRYEVYQDSEDENTFVFQELWENSEGLENHNNQTYSKEFFASFDKLQQKPVLYLSKQI